MKITVRPLGEGFPTAVRGQYNPQELELEFVDLSYLEEVVLDGTVEKFRDTLTFRGHLTSRVAHTCARCLKQVEEPIDHAFEMVYDIRGKEEVDTLDDLREMLILDHPIRFLCREDCPGLCPGCGADLSKSSCTCTN
jgi:uncharacterized protein